MPDNLTCPSCGTVCPSAHKFCPGCGFPMAQLRDHSKDPMIGCTLPGGHVVLELIDVGGMGRVYRAEQKLLGRTVAVKIIHPHLLGDPTVEARFITEARAASQLNHPNSVNVIDFGKFDGRFYMVMEFLRGKDLATIAHEEGPLEIGRIIDVLCQTLAALEEAHHNKIIHRDLKPENIVLSPLRSGGDFVKVLDFGLAKVMEEAQKDRITDPGMVCGTPEYMAPEQARGEEVDHRTDLYACGVLLYELLAGQLPFEASDPRATVMMHLRDPVPDVQSKSKRRIPPALIEVVQKALQKKAGDRFQSANDFSDALQASNQVISVPSRSISGQHISCPECRALVPDTQKFCGECGTPMARRKRPTSPMPTIPPLSESGDDLSAAFVGRDSEVERLLQWRDDATESLSVVAISGEPGVGKSRLLDEVQMLLDPDDDVVVRTGPDIWRARIAGHTLRTAVIRLADLPVDGGEAWDHASTEARAGLALLFDRPPPASSRRRDDGNRLTGLSKPPPEAIVQSDTAAVLVAALRWALDQAARRKPDGRVMLIIDDIHECDGASRRALADLADDPPPIPGVVLVTFRLGHDPGWYTNKAMPLRGVPLSEGVALLVGTSSEPPRPEQIFPPEIIERGHVAPLYVRHLLRFRRDGGQDPPPGLADLLATRVERLKNTPRRLLQALSIWGDRIPRENAEAFVENDENVGAVLATLESAGFIVIGPDEVAISHPLVRDVTVASMPAEVRNKLHRQALPLLQSPALEVQAMHAKYGGSAFEALAMLESVANRALGLDDTEGAVDALREALARSRREMMGDDLEDPMSAVVMFSWKLADALAIGGKHNDAEGVLREALTMVPPRSVERPRLLISLANVARLDRRPHDAYTHLEDALELAESIDHRELVETIEGMRHRWVAGT